MKSILTGRKVGRITELHFEMVWSMKLFLPPEEVAALLEHAVDDAAYRHYARCSNAKHGGIMLRIAGMNPVESRWIGFALMPQAGVAIGTTIIFELIGPLFTQIALSKVAASQERGN